MIYCKHFFLSVLSQTLSVFVICKYFFLCIVKTESLRVFFPLTTLPSFQDQVALSGHTEGGCHFSSMRDN